METSMMTVPLEPSETLVTWGSPRASVLWERYNSGHSFPFKHASVSAWLRSTAGCTQRGGFERTSSESRQREPTRSVTPDGAHATCRHVSAPHFLLSTLFQATVRCAVQRSRIQQNSFCKFDIHTHRHTPVKWHLIALPLWCYMSMAPSNGKLQNLCWPRALVWMYLYHFLTYLPTQSLIHFAFLLFSFQILLFWLCFFLSSLSKYKIS